MGEALVPQERLQPSLLDRLTDDEPDKKVEAAEQRVLSKARLRQAVLRDLAWLFNTTRLESEVNLQKFPYARRSAINFGLPALSGLLSSSLDVMDLERAVRQAIIDFEPRIDAKTLEVSVMVETTALAHHSVIGVEIRGHLWAQPVPLELLIRTRFDLETGHVQMADVQTGNG
jgi:type VI secretion system protein ImpF